MEDLPVKGNEGCASLCRMLEPAAGCFSACNSSCTLWLDLVLFCSCEGVQLAGTSCFLGASGC